MADILEEDCNGRVYPVDEFDALNTARCRLRGALLTLEGIAKGRYGSADSEATRARAVAISAELWPLYETVKEAFQAERGKKFG